jgi:hypothetical protein
MEIIIVYSDRNIYYINALVSAECKAIIVVAIGPNSNHCSLKIYITECSPNPDTNGRGFSNLPVSAVDLLT